MTTAGVDTQGADGGDYTAFDHLVRVFGLRVSAAHLLPLRGSHSGHVGTKCCACLLRLAKCYMLE